MIEGNGRMGSTFGEIAQLGYVTRDIDRSMRMFHDLMGIGPWFHFSNRMDIVFETRAVSIDTRVAFANNGATQVELIQQLDGERSMFTAFLADVRVKLHGLQHYGFWVDDHDAAVRAAVDRGFVELQSTSVARGRVIYFRDPDTAELAIEFAESTRGRAAMRRMVREAAIGWDGAEPYRAFTP